MPKDLDYYMSLNYPVELTREEGVFVAAHPDLPGCIAQGDTADEAVTNLDEAREAWIAVGLEDKAFIPEPLPTEFSGRLSLRIPASLHARLAHASVRQGVSLNQLLTVILSEWSSGVSVKDKVVEELRSLLAATKHEGRTPDRLVVTVTKTETRRTSGFLLGGAASNAITRVGN
jgi:antitoxin HicB